MSESTRPPDAQTRYRPEDVFRLNADAEFQRRVGADEELARLFNPTSDVAAIRAELAHGLGVGRTVAGIHLAPVTLGGIGLLTVVGNEFAKSKRDWSAGFPFQLGQLTEALFVLANGPKAVAAWGDCFRYQKTLDAWRKDATSSRHIADACLEAERGLAESLRVWDAAVMEWGTRYVRLGEGETFLSAMQALDEWIGQGLDGFKLFPQTANPADESEAAKKTRSPFGLRLRLRLAFARLLARFAQRLACPTSGGSSRC